MLLMCYIIAVQAVQTLRNSLDCALILRGFLDVKGTLYTIFPFRDFIAK